MIEDWDLDEAYAHLFKSRRCHPQLQMVRAAACVPWWTAPTAHVACKDLLSGNMGSGQLRIVTKRPQAGEMRKKFQALERLRRWKSLVWMWAGMSALHSWRPWWASMCGVVEEKDLSTGEFVLERTTPPGVYQYKFIVDGEWRPISCSV